MINIEKQKSTKSQLIDLPKDETGRYLVQCATFLASIFDSSTDIVEYRTRLLNKIKPNRDITDPAAKPADWINRCVSGTEWENPTLFKSHNMSVEYAMSHITSCDSRLENERTADIVCDVTINWGCRFTVPYSWVFEAVTSIKERSLGEIKMVVDRDGRMERQDGIGLLPSVGNVGESFDMVAFGGDVKFYEREAAPCRKEKEGGLVRHEGRVPTARALVRGGFTHEEKDLSKEYGVVDTDGCRNLLLCKKKSEGYYKIMGVWIDDEMATKKEKHTATIRK